MTRFSGTFRFVAEPALSLLATAGHLPRVVSRAALLPSLLLRASPHFVDWERVHASRTSALPTHARGPFLCKLRNAVWALRLKTYSSLKQRPGV